MRNFILLTTVVALAAAFFTISSCKNPSSSQEVVTENKQDQVKSVVNWNYDYIQKVPPILMYDDLIKIIGQNDKPIPYYYVEAVKLTGHSCMIVAASWTMTRLALEQLYPNDEIPKRGQIKIEMPGAEDEWNIGVFGEVMEYITGASSKNGFSGSIFAKANPQTIRRNKLIYTDEKVGTAPPKMEWIFTRIDNGARVAMSWDIRKVRPAINENNLAEYGDKLASGTVTDEEYKKFITDWNSAAQFVLGNSVEGLFTFRVLENNI